jgi:hypothetical protein
MKFNMKNKKSNVFTLLLLFIIFIMLLCIFLHSRNWFIQKQMTENFVNLHSLLGLENTPIVEVPQNNVQQIKEFPPSSIPIVSNLSNSDDFKGSDNQELLNQLSGVKPDIKNKMMNKNIEDFVRKKNKHIQQPSQKPQQINLKKKIKSSSETFDIQPMNQCQFVQGECPSGKKMIGGFGFQGLPEGVQFYCGNGNGKNNSGSIQPAKLIAEINDGKISNIVVLDGGKGYHSSKKYKLKIESKTGTIDQIDSDVIVGDDGKVKVIQILNGGNGFQDTPKVSILHDSLENGEKCNLCC